MGSLITIFREMPAPRSSYAQRHDLLDILTIALVASVCGARELPAPLATLTLDGELVTGDAIHAPGRDGATVPDHGGDWVAAFFADRQACYWPSRAASTGSSR